MNFYQKSFINRVYAYILSKVGIIMVQSLKSYYELNTNHIFNLVYKH